MRAFVDGPFDGMLRRERSDSRQCHHPVGSATECGELEDPPYARKTGNAIHLALKLPGKAYDIIAPLDRVSSARPSLLRLGLNGHSREPSAGIDRQ